MPRVSRILKIKIWVNLFGFQYDLHNNSIKKKKNGFHLVRSLPQNDLFCAIGVSAIDSNATLFFVSNGGGPVNDTVENSLTILFGLCLLPLLDIFLGCFNWLSWLEVLSTVYSLKIPGRNMKKLNRPVMAPTYLQTLENKHNEIL